MTVLLAAVRHTQLRRRSRRVGDYGTACTSRVSHRSHVTAPKVQSRCARFSSRELVENVSACLPRRRRRRPCATHLDEMPHGRGGNSGSVDGDTVFVRNLAYDVTDETLAAHCSDAGAVRRAVVVRGGRRREPRLRLRDVRGAGGRAERGAHAGRQRAAGPQNQRAHEHGSGGGRRGRRRRRQRRRRRAQARARGDGRRRRAVGGAGAQAARGRGGGEPEELPAHRAQPRVHVLGRGAARGVRAARRRRGERADAAERQAPGLRLRADELARGVRRGDRRPQRAEDRRADGRRRFRAEQNGVRARRRCAGGAEGGRRRRAAEGGGCGGGGGGGGGGGDDDDVDVDDDDVDDDDGSDDDDNDDDDDGDDDDDDDDDGDDDDEGDDDEDDDGDAEEDEEEEEEAAAEPPAAKPAAKPAKAAPAAADGDRSLEATIFVRGVPLSCDEPELHDAFQRYGKLQYCRVVRDPATGLSRGSAFVCYNAVGHAQLALAAASGGRGPTIHGQPLTLSAATSRQARGGSSRGSGGRGTARARASGTSTSRASVSRRRATQRRRGCRAPSSRSARGRGHRRSERVLAGPSGLCGVVDGHVRTSRRRSTRTLLAAAAGPCATAGRSTAPASPQAGEAGARRGAARPHGAAAVTRLRLRRV